MTDQLGKTNSTKLKASSPTNLLKEACKEIGRPDLYEPLSNVLILNPLLAERNLKHVLKQKRFGTAAGVLLYRRKDHEAKEYFQMAFDRTKSDSLKHRRLRTILDNFTTVAQIGRSLWRKSGKYAKEREENQLRREGIRRLKSRFQK